MKKAQIQINDQRERIEELEHKVLGGREHAIALQSRLAVAMGYVPQIELCHAEAESKSTETLDYFIVVDSVSAAARIVSSDDDGYLDCVDGEKDIFPLCMAFEVDRFLVGGKRSAVPLRNLTRHGNTLRSYRIRWM